MKCVVGVVVVGVVLSLVGSLMPTHEDYHQLSVWPVVSLAIASALSSLKHSSVQNQFCRLKSEELCRYRFPYSRCSSNETLTRGVSTWTK